MKRSVLNNFKKKHLTLLFMLGALPVNGQSPKGGEEPSIPDAAMQLKVKGGDAQKRRALLHVLRTRPVRTPEDIDAIVETANDKDISHDALSGLERIENANDPQVRSKLAALVDVNDETSDLRIVRSVLKANLKHKVPGALDRMRGRMDREPKTKIRDRKDRVEWWRDNWKKGRQVGVVQALAQTLAESGDRGSMEKLFALDEVLATDQAASILSIRAKITSCFCLRRADGVIPIQLRHDAMVAMNVQSSNLLL